MYFPNVLMFCGIGLSNVAGKVIGILSAMGYKSFEWRSFVLLLLVHCSYVSPISRYILTIVFSPTHMLDIDI